MRAGRGRRGCRRGERRESIKRVGGRIGQFFPRVQSTRRSKKGGGGQRAGKGRPIPLSIPS